MIYAINRHNKEHIDVTWRGSPHSAAEHLNSDWLVTNADAAGWIAWRGDDRRPLPDDQICVAQLKDGSTLQRECKNLRWKMHGTSTDITAYRPILSGSTCTAEEDAAWAEKDAQFNGAKFEVVTDAWDGEGLPPIGTVCRIEVWNGEWVLLDEEYRVDYIGERVVVATTVGTKREVERVFDAQVQFFPRMSPEERARNAIQCAAGDSQMLTLYQARKVYAAIRDGKIPGVVVGGGDE